jgi:hypothetical protein
MDLEHPLEVGCNGLQLHAQAPVASDRKTVLPDHRHHGGPVVLEDLRSARMEPVRNSRSGREGGEGEGGAGGWALTDMAGAEEAEVLAARRRRRGTLVTEVGFCRYVGLLAEQEGPATPGATGAGYINFRQKHTLQRCHCYPIYYLIISYVAAEKIIDSLREN